MKANSLLVSVVTPALNRGDYIPALLESVKRQTHPLIEHVVVDGRSTDHTLDILRSEEGRPGFRWLSEPDEGVYEAVNKGLKLCSGDILCYLNTDDRFFDYSVEVVVNAFGINPGVDLIFGDLLAFDEDARRGEINFYPKRVREHLRRGGVISQPTVFWRRAAGERIGEFDVRLRLAADIDYWQRMLKHARALKIDEVLAYEGHHQHRLTFGTMAAAEARTELAAIRSRLHGRELTTIERLIDKLEVALVHRISTVRFLLARMRPSKNPSMAWINFRSQDRFRVDRVAMAMSLIPVIGRRYRGRVVTERSLETTEST